MDSKGRPLIVGHRGSSAEYPENTLIAFEQGLKQKAEMFELDVRLAKDGTPVVMHDNKLLRIAGRPGSVSQRSWKFLQTLDVGSWKNPRFSQARLATLDEVLRFVTPHVPVDLEMKFTRLSDPLPLVKTVAKILRDLHLTRRVLVSSFRRSALPLLEAEIPEILTAGLYDKTEGDWAKRDLEALAVKPLRQGAVQEGDLPFRGRMMCLHHQLATADFVKTVNGLGGGILCWTVNEPEDMLRLASYGVTGIIANDPGLLRRTLLGEQAD